MQVPVSVLYWLCLSLLRFMWYSRTFAWNRQFSDSAQDPTFHLTAEIREIYYWYLFYGCWEWWVDRGKRDTCEKWWARPVESPGSGAKDGAQNYMKLFVAHKMTRNNTPNKVHVAASELPQLLSQNTFGEATAQSRCRTLCSSKVDWNIIVGSQGGTCPSALQLASPMSQTSPLAVVERCRAVKEQNWVWIYIREELAAEMEWWGSCLVEPTPLVSRLLPSQTRKLNFVVANRLGRR